jgi:hypothetical protein
MSELELPGKLVRDERDARRYTRLTLGYALLIYAVLTLALTGVIPAWVLVPVVPLVYVRLSLALHELMHVCPASNVSAFHRLTLLMESPISLGYREHRAIHFTHHRFSGTARDPELFQIVGGSVRAFANALISPERHAVTWVRAHGVTRELAIEAAVRLTVFSAFLVWNPRVFLVYWITLRLSIGTGAFIFHHVLHNQHGRLGTFPLPLPAGLRATVRLLVGREPLVILSEHERHHRWPRVRASDLRRLPLASDLSALPVTPADCVIPAKG